MEGVRVSRISILIVLVATLIYYTLSDKQNVFNETLSYRAQDTVTKIQTGANHRKRPYNYSDAAGISSIDDDPQWWLHLVDQIAKPYQASLDTSWCQRFNPPSHSSHANKKQWRVSQNRHKRIEAMQPKTGMYLVKVPKAGSSTVAGVTIQIAYSVAKRLDINTTSSTTTTRPYYCAHHVHHGQQYAERQEPSFVWTILREPATRAVSLYYFDKVSRKGLPATDERMIQALQGAKNFQLRYVGREPPFGNVRYDPNNVTTTQITEWIADIVRDRYQFIAITERMGESLAVFQLLFGFDDASMIVLSSKKAGGFDDGQYKDGVCHAIQKANRSQAVDQFIQTGFFDRNYDYFLYAVANRSLDWTIEALGRDRVTTQVRKLQGLQQVVQEHCSDEAVFPCTQDGQIPNVYGAEKSCYFGDVGCGHACVQETIQKYQAGTL
jgi:hypothetical protein